MKGSFNDNPPRAKHTYTWDINIVLEHCRKMDTDKLTLKQLSLKLATLMAIMSAQRCQTLSLIKTDNIKTIENKVVITIDQLLKQTRPGFNNPTLMFEKYVDKEICVVHCLQNYLSRTQSVRSGKWLFVSYSKPHNEVSSATISRWIKSFIAEAGVDINIFGAHSVRGASTSAAFIANMNIDNILKAGEWSNATTVASFYNRPILNKEGCYNTKLLQ